MKHLVFATLLFSSFLSFGQSKKFAFKLGDEYELPRGTADLSFFGSDKDGIVNLTLKKEELSVVKFDPKTLSQGEGKVIELPEQSKYFNSETVADFKNGCYWLHSDYDKESTTESLFYDKIDITTGKIAEANHKLISTTKMAGGSFFSANFFTFTTGYSNKYFYNYNADKSKLLVTYRLFPEERNDKINYDKIGFQVFDDKMNKIWGDEFKMPYTEAIMDNIDFSLDVNGNAYLLAKVYDSEKRKERDKETGLPAYHYEVLKFTQGSKKFTNTNISIGEYFIRSASMIESAGHDMLVACSYSKKAKGVGTDGVFLATIDQQGKVNKYKNGYYEFPLAELQKYESKRSKRKMEKKDDYEIPYVVLKDIVATADGGLFMSFEQQYVVATEHTSGATNMRYYTYEYYYEDILGAKLNAKGDFEWMRKIPKRQVSSTSTVGSMSFKLITDTSGYYFLFLDHKKNMELEEDEVPKTHRDGFGGQVVVAKLDNSGELTKEIVFDTRDEEVMIFPTQFTRINTNQFIGRARVKRNHFKPLLITVN